MNFLAHAYLSFSNPQILVGNMISDFVKGKAKFSYASQIQQGIALHRAIDDFTDFHPVTAQAKEFFRADYRLYSGPIVDIVYDHFLAADNSIFTEDELLQFSQEVYAILEQHATELPQNFLMLLPFMKKENWLLRYRTVDGIAKSLRGLVRRSAFLSDHETAVALLQNHYPELQICYTAFFDDVKNFAKQKLAQLIE